MDEQAKIQAMRRPQTRRRAPKGEHSELGTAFQEDLKVDRGKFEGIVKRLLEAHPVKREDVKVGKKKPEKLIPPQR